MGARSFVTGPNPPISGKRRSPGTHFMVLSGTLPRHSSDMSAATEFRWKSPAFEPDHDSGIGRDLASAPLYVARFQRDGHITAVNPALKQRLGKKGKQVL